MTKQKISISKFRICNYKQQGHDVLIILLYAYAFKQNVINHTIINVIKAVKITKKNRNQKKNIFLLDMPDCIFLLIIGAVDFEMILAKLCFNTKISFQFDLFRMSRTNQKPKVFLLNKIENKPAVRVFR